MIGALFALLNRALGRSDIYFLGSLYMRRWRFLHFKLFGVRVHNIIRDDKDRELHDHPFSFVSIIVRGGYREITPQGVRIFFRAPAVVVHRAEDLHRLEVLDGRSVWTLVFRGPLRREWGFMTAAGWLHWRAFTEARGNVVEEDRPYCAPTSTGVSRARGFAELRFASTLGVVLAVAIVVAGLVGHVLSDRDRAIAARDRAEAREMRALDGWNGAQAMFRACEAAADAHLAIDDDACACWVPDGVGR